MPTLRASTQGLAQIKQARNDRGWTVDDPRWLVEASHILQPALDWQEAGPFAPGISEGTWKTFLRGKRRINAVAFKAYCQILGLTWYDIVDRDIEDSSDSTLSRSKNWERDAPDVSRLYGRYSELTTLEQWITQEQCRLIMVFGMGGIGKTALVVKLLKQIEQPFDYIVWRSLRSKPSLPDLISNLLLSFHQRATVSTVKALLHQLMICLQSHRCLIVLDQAEAVLEEGRLAGCYRQAYENYGELWQYIATQQHYSCVLVLGQEELKEISFLQHETRAVRSLHLTGLADEEAQELLHANGLSGEARIESRLIRLYRGNPFALRVISTLIKDYFAGSMGEFLKHALVLGDDICYVLHQQFRRLSELEKEILTQLAIAGQPQSYLNLQGKISSLSSGSEVLEALASLRRRSLTETSSQGSEVLFTLQPIVMKYVEKFCRPVNLL